MVTRALLVGWPGAHCQALHPLIDAGRMPCLEGLIERGVMGGLSSLSPKVPTLIWSSVATGTRAYQHRVLGDWEIREPSGQVVPVTARTRHAPALWEILAARERRCHVVGWRATHFSPAARGAIVSEAFGHPGVAKTVSMLEGAIVPAALREALAELWMQPEEADEELIRFFLPDGVEAGQLRHPWIASIANALAHTFSRHAAFTWLLENEEWDFATVCLPAIEWLSRGLNAFPAPGMEAVAEGELELLEDVICAAYRLHDRLLARVLELAGEDTSVLVVSPYGFRTGPRGPTAEGHTWQHQRYSDVGLLVAAGPTMDRDALVHGAGALDIAPTILQLFDLPVGRNMEGRVLVELLTPKPRIASIPSWHCEIGRRVETRGETEPLRPQTPGEALLRQFAALGVVSPAAEDPLALHRRSVEQALQWNLACSHLCGSQLLEALPILEKLCDQEPENPDFTIQLAICQLRLGLLDDARDTCQGLLEESPGSVAALLLLARIATLEGRSKQSLEHLQDAERLSGPSAEICNRQGLAYLNLRLWAEANTAFLRTLELDPDNASAHLGIARAMLGLHSFREAADAALDSIGLDYRQPVAHYMLGMALLRQDKVKEAIKGFEVASRLAPSAELPHHQLLRSKRRLGAPESELAEHRRDLAAAQAKSKTSEEISLAARERQQQRRLARTEVRRGWAAEWEAGREVEDALSSETLAPSMPMNHVLVSGLPRAGAGLMMQMLAAGGMQTMTDDGNRDSTDWLAIQQLPRNPRILDEAQGKAVKVTSVLMLALPRIHHYKVIFMHRPIAEVAVSQRRVLQSMGRDAAELPLEESARLLARHRDGVLSLLRQAPNVDLLEIDYSGLCCAPADYVARLQDFLGPERLPDARAVARVVDARRYRIRMKREKAPYDLTGDRNKSRRSARA